MRQSAAFYRRFFGLAGVNRRQNSSLGHFHPIGVAHLSCESPRPVQSTPADSQNEYYIRWLPLSWRCSVVAMGGERRRTRQALDDRAIGPVAAVAAIGQVREGRTHLAEERDLGIQLIDMA